MQTNLEELVFEEDGSLDPLVKFLLYSVLAIAVGKALWTWLADDVVQWITVDLRGVVADHPWWSSLIMAALVILLLGVGVLSSGATATSHVPDDAYEASAGSHGQDVLVFKLTQLASMTATGFEQACADLLARDGFRTPRRVGGAGDLGVDVLAHDHEDRLVVLQCKQYQKPVGSGLRQSSVARVLCGFVWGRR